MSHFKNRATDCRSLMSSGGSVNLGVSTFSVSLAIISLPVQLTRMSAILSNCVNSSLGQKISRVSWVLDCYQIQFYACVLANWPLSTKFDSNIVGEPFNIAIAMVVITNAIITDLFTNFCLFQITKFTHKKNYHRSSESPV